MSIMQTAMVQKPLFSKPKLIFIILLLLAGFGFYVYATSHYAKSRGSVLGEGDALPTQVPIDFNGMKKTANSYLDSVVKTSQTAVQSAVKQGSEVVADVASQAVDNVKDRIVDSTVGSAVKQIEKLPAEEQEKIREYICK